IIPTSSTIFSTLSLHDALPISCEIITAPTCPATIKNTCEYQIKSALIIPTFGVKPAVPSKFHSLPKGSDIRIMKLCPCVRSSERSEEHTSELQSRENLVCRLLL